MYDSDFGGMVFFMVFYFGFWGLLLVSSLVQYLLRGFGIWRISKQLGMRGGVLGFVPVANLYQHGALAGDEILVLGRRLRSPGIWMVVVPIASQVVFLGGYLLFLFGTFWQISESSYYNSAFPVGLFILTLLGILFFIGLLTVSGTVQLVLNALVNLRIFSYYMAPDRALVHTLFCSFVPLYEAIYLFVLGKRTPINPPVVPPNRAIVSGTTYYTQQTSYAPQQTPPSYTPPQSPAPYAPPAPSPYAPQQTPPPYLPPQSPPPYAPPAPPPYVPPAPPAPSEEEKSEET